MRLTQSVPLCQSYQFPQSSHQSLLQSNKFESTTLQMYSPKPSLKIRTASAIFWIYLGGKAQKIFLFRNKTFLYFKIESWNFQYLFEIEFGETSKNCNSFSVFRQLLFSFFLMVVWLTWNFVRFHEILFQTDSERFRLLSWKKKFYP